MRVVVAEAMTDNHGMTSRALYLTGVARAKKLIID